MRTLIALLRNSRATDTPSAAEPAEFLHRLTPRLAACALLFIGAVAFGQSAVTPDCSADGTVVNSVTGAPIARAHVSAAGGANQGAVAQTDATGRWSLEHLACGQYTLTASRAGYLQNQTNLSQSHAVSLVAGVPLHDANLELTPQAVITGRVLDEQGDPVQNAQITVMTSRVSNGIRGFQARMSAISNDLGEYRAAGLNAGKYILCARGPGMGWVPASGAIQYGESCYPGPPDAGAAGAMDVPAGYEGRIDFSLAPLPLFHVRGAVSGGPEGAWVAVEMTDRASVSARRDGTFDFAGVPPGSYTLTATTLQPARRYMARVPVEVGGADVEGLHVHLEPGVNVTGTVKVVSTTGGKIDKPQYSVVLRSPDVMAAPGNWDDSRTSFTIADVMPGSYRLEFSAPAPFYLKSATTGDKDMASSEVMIGPGAANIEVVLSDDSGAVEGDVSTDDGPSAASILLTRDGAQPRNGRTSPDGHFKMDTIPPGDYTVYAWDDISNVEWANPEWMQRNGKGVAVTVGPGQTAQVKLIRQAAPVQ